MKQLSFCLLLVALCLNVCSQERTSEEYFLKSKRQKTAGWLLLAGGFVATTTGIAIGSAHVWEDIGNNENIRGTGLTIGGLVAMAGSIPFFVMSGKNNRKSISVSFAPQIIPQPNNKDFIRHSVPSFQLKIPIGK